MILGRDHHAYAPCFDEIDAAVAALRAPDDAPVVFNAHQFPGAIPPDAVVYNLENRGQIHSIARFASVVPTLWDFSRRNVDVWRQDGPDGVLGARPDVLHVPIGYHASMERFQKRPWDACDYDVVFAGAVNERRAQILDALRRRGLRVCLVPDTLYGAGRDDLLSRSRLALNMLFYETGAHPVLRSAHCAANRLPVLCEHAPETPDWCLLSSPYVELVDRAETLVRRRREYADHLAESAYVAFRMNPMRLPPAATQERPS